MLYLFCWMIALSTHDPGAAEATDWMKPADWSGNFWGPAAWRARQAGQLPPLPMHPAMARWQRWGRTNLRDGDIVFRLGDARAVRGFLPLSRFIARATGSPFSHTGIVAIENELPVVYDCSSAGIQRQPFEVWMLDCIGPMGVKRLKSERRGRIPGVLAFCRAAFERQVPFDYGFRMDDDEFYCLELTEKAFRSQGLALSEPVRIGDWEYLSSFPLMALGNPARDRTGTRSPDHSRANRLPAGERAQRRLGLSLAGDRRLSQCEGIPGCHTGHARGTELPRRFRGIRLRHLRGSPVLRRASPCACSPAWSSSPGSAESLPPVVPTGARRA